MPRSFPHQVRVMASDGGTLYASTPVDGGSLSTAARVSLPGPGRYTVGFLPLHPAPRPTCTFDAGLTPFTIPLQRLPDWFFDNVSVTVSW